MHTEVMAALSRNPQLLRRAQFSCFTFCVKSETQTRVVFVERGQLTVALALGAVFPAFTINATDVAWQEYAQPTPKPGYNDIFAMIESGRAEIDGRDMLAFFSNLFLVKGVVAALIKGEAAW